MGVMSTKDQGDTAPQNSETGQPETGKPETPKDKSEAVSPAKPDPKPVMPSEIGGPKGPEPTRYGDWERKGRVSDF
ncbi:DUF1674 domain-containing protein [Acetobacteraceae bacterium H6797]|nr:DUF1674 domain-containing protein [Acetobacteraceae bacterium H6797]